MYSFRASAGHVDLAFTDRYGGVSRAPYAELNLAVNGSDSPEAKAENHRLLLADFADGAPYADLYQVHGDVVVDAECGTRPEADGIVTAERDLVLLVRTADCVPVLFADEAAGVIGAAHAGRKGMAVGVVPATIARMRALGATRIKAWVGPHVCGKCYEVPAEMQEEIAAVEPAARATTSWGTPSLDVGAGVLAQLAREGVETVDASRCTRESEDLYSYRRDGVGMSLGALIRLRGAR
ncbi:peptidoglycan editing factor PgeF [Nocardioides sp.]|uniref:peptidoglycan editing factor PgeF n=1 Tax=Nocardioides sp. TaxID=35761 RepID=UPI00198F4AAC|nr:peptidoglycan editing factor PgeF [Nocardioides sp.]MBC7275218.1 peptidoglycan editing factor PgeF [Nocardioides sp.]